MVILKCNISMKTIGGSLKYQYPVQWVFKSAIFLCEYKASTETTSVLMLLIEKP